MGSGTDYTPAAIVDGVKASDDIDVAGGAAGGVNAAMMHKKILARRRANADAASAAGAGVGVQLLRGMLAAGGALDPSAIADLVTRHPADQRAMVTYLQQTVGNEYTTLVMQTAIERGASVELPPAPRTPGTTGNALSDHLTRGEREGGELGAPGAGNLTREHTLELVKDAIRDAGDAARDAALKLRMDALVAPAPAEHVGFFASFALSIASKYLGAIPDGIATALTVASDRSIAGELGKATSSLGASLAKKLVDAGAGALASSDPGGKHDARAEHAAQVDTIGGRLREAFIALRTSATADAGDTDLISMLDVFAPAKHTPEIYMQLIDDKLARFRQSGIVDSPDRDAGWMTNDAGERVRTGLGHQHRGAGGAAATRSVARVHFMSGAPPRYGYRLSAHVSSTELDTPTRQHDELAVDWVDNVADTPASSTPIRDKAPDVVDVIDSWVPPEFETEAVRAHQQRFGSDPAYVVVDDSDPLRYGPGRAAAAARNKAAIAAGDVGGFVSWPVGTPTIASAPGAT